MYVGVNWPAEMDVGIAPPTFATDGWIAPPERLLRMARRAEDRGFSGLWACEHLAHPPGRGYSRLAPLTTIATFAGATDAIGVGTSVLLLPLRQPVWTAKRAATLQHLADGRLTLGFGTGWVPAEFEAVGVPFEERGRRFTEALQLVRELLAGGETTFEGEFYAVDDFSLEPVPERPPKLLVGGGGVAADGSRRLSEPVMDRIVRHADGWLAPPTPLEAIEEDWRDIAAHAERLGRDPADLDRRALAWLHLVPGVDGATARERQRAIYVEERGASRERAETAMSNQLAGDEDEVAARIDRYRRLGFDELILGPTTNDPDRTDRQLELWADRFL